VFGRAQSSPEGPGAWIPEVKPILVRVEVENILGDKFIVFLTDMSVRFLVVLMYDYRLVSLILANL